MNIYLDNASTTALDPMVLEVMLPYMDLYFGNPSSMHKYGRKTKAAIENSRSNIATMIGVAPGEIFFTSGGTEGNNMILRSAIESLEIRNIISSKLEHASVYETLQNLRSKKNIHIHFIETDLHGEICQNNLKNLLNKIEGKTLVTLMHANNEIGNLISLEQIGNLCKDYGAFFHTDSVQTIAKYDLNFGSLNVDFATAAAHKFHGPKGIGFVYINSKNRLNPLFTGGAQERGMRAGTENISGIVGMEKALEISLSTLSESKKHILFLKKKMIDELKKNNKIFFNGQSANLEKSLYTILNVAFSVSDNENMLLFRLDNHGIYASAGSACSSGANKASRVINVIRGDDFTTSIRFSFSKYNTTQEIDLVLKYFLNI